MASLTDLFNRALSEVGDLRISDPDESTKQARAVSDAWESVRREVLTKHPWNCAKAYASIPALAEAPPWRWSYQFNLPDDYVAIREVDVTPNRWEVVGKRVLYANEAGPLSITYTFDEVDTTQYAPGLFTAMSWRLAAEIVEELTASNTKKSDVLTIYSVALRDAKQADGREAPPQRTKRGRWLTARMS